jgi:hypothetical protein
MKNPIWHGCFSIFHFWNKENFTMKNSILHGCRITMVEEIRQFCNTVVEAIRRFSTAYGISFSCLSPSGLLDCIMDGFPFFPWAPAIYSSFESGSSRKKVKRRNTWPPQRGFVTGQFMTVLAIYYAPLHRAFQGPHKVVVVIPHLDLVHANQFDRDFAPLLRTPKWRFVWSETVQETFPMMNPLSCGN